MAFTAATIKYQNVPRVGRVNIINTMECIELTSFGFIAQRAEVICLTINSRDTFFHDVMDEACTPGNPLLPVAEAAH